MPADPRTSTLAEQVGRLASALGSKRLAKLVPAVAALEAEAAQLRAENAGLKRARDLSELHVITELEAECARLRETSQS